MNETTLKQLVLADFSVKQAMDELGKARHVKRTLSMQYESAQKDIETAEQWLAKAVTVAEERLEKHSADVSKVLARVGDSPKDVEHSYDFEHGKRGAVVVSASPKEKVTINLDEEIVNWFRWQVDQAGGRSYLDLINETLHEHIKAWHVSAEPDPNAV